MPLEFLEKAFFLDRDGVINKDVGYLYKWSEFEFLPGVLEALNRIKNKNYKIIIVTNQSGIARGFYGESDFHALNEEMLKFLRDKGISIDAVYFCPHHPNGIVENYSFSCECRKPKPQMILRAVKQFRISVEDSIMVGDKQTDIDAANLAKIGRSYLLTTNSSHESGRFNSLLDVLNHLKI